MTEQCYSTWTGLAFAFGYHVCLAKACLPARAPLLSVLSSTSTLLPRMGLQAVPLSHAVSLLQRFLVLLPNNSISKYLRRSSWPFLHYSWPPSFTFSAVSTHSAFPSPVASVPAAPIPSALPSWKTFSDKILESISFLAICILDEPVLVSDDSKRLAFILQKFTEMISKKKTSTLCGQKFNMCSIVFVARTLHTLAS